MHLDFEEIVEGSGCYIIRGFRGEPYKTDIDLVAFLKNLGAGVCEIAAAKGDLTIEGNARIGLKVIDLGYRVLQFYALKGTSVTRWAERVGSDAVFDYYRVDLIEAMEQLNECH